MKAAFGTGSLALALLALPAQAVPPGYALVWSDEFDGEALDRTKWEYRYPGEREGTLVSEDAVRLDGQGHLVLTTSLRGGMLHVGMIGTQGTFQARYGYFEARIRFQALQGHHGAFWLQSPHYGRHKDDPGRSGAEIDIIEYFGSGRMDGGAAVNLHWNRPPGHITRTARVGVSRPQDEFHVYAVHWTRHGYEFLVDGKRVFATREGLSHVCQYVVLSLLSSPWERRRLSLAALPDSMTVDYIRVYAADPPAAQNESRSMPRTASGGCSG